MIRLLQLSLCHLVLRGSRLFSLTRVSLGSPEQGESLSQRQAVQPGEFLLNRERADAWRAGSATWSRRRGEEQEQPGVLAAGGAGEAEEGAEHHPAGEEVHRGLGSDLQGRDGEGQWGTPEPGTSCVPPPVPLWCTDSSVCVLLGPLALEIYRISPFSIQNHNFISKFSVTCVVFVTLSSSKLDVEVSSLLLLAVDQLPSTTS